MQKKLIALAVAGAAAGFMSAPVLAQSQVTLYGTFDAGIRNVDNVNGAGDNLLSMDSAGTYNSNRWGMTGSEDLGNGMKANFTLEGGFMSGTGVGSISGGLFGRKQIVGLSGGWGRLDLGRNYTTIFYTTGAYDPFGYKYTGIIPIAGLDGARRNNDIQYTSVNLNGFTVRAEHALGEVVGDNSASATNEAGLSYANGPLNLGLAYGSQKNATNTLTTKQWTLGGGYNFDPFKVMAGYHIKKADQAGGGTFDTRNVWIGGRYQMAGANALSLAYYDTNFDSPVANADGKSKLWILGFVHNLSKRTELYADIDHRALSGTSVLKMPAPDTRTQDRQLGISVGINHAF